MNAKEMSPCERVAEYFDDSNADMAVRALRSYYAVDSLGPHWTGSVFDRLITREPSGMFTSTDMLAVSMLSVNVPSRAAIWLIEDGEANHMLAKIPDVPTIWSDPGLLDPEGRAWKLWDLIDGCDDIGDVITSKLLASKRPHLLPVFDQHVGKALAIGSKQWEFWQKVARHQDVHLLLDRVQQVRIEAGVPAGVSMLRVIDVVVWMRQHGWTTHTPKWEGEHSPRCRFRCDFSHFDGT